MTILVFYKTGMVLNGRINHDPCSNSYIALQLVRIHHPFAHDNSTPVIEFAASEPSPDQKT